MTSLVVFVCLACAMEYERNVRSANPHTDDMMTTLLTGAIATMTTLNTDWTAGYAAIVAIKP